MLRATNENYAEYDVQSDRGGNLSPLQKEYKRLWLSLRPMQDVGIPYGCLGVGFSAHARGGRGPLLCPSRPIVSARRARMLSVVPLPSRLAFEIEGASLQKHRLHFSDQCGFVENGDPHFGGPRAKQEDANVLWTADAAKHPLQDHPEFLDRRFSPSALGNQIRSAQGQSDDVSAVRTPIGGRVTIVRNELHVQFMVENAVVFRFAKEDADKLDFLKTSGEVCAGDAVIRLRDYCDYLEAIFDDAGWPVIDRIGGDVLSASSRLYHLQFVLRAVAQMRDYGLWCDGDTTIEPVMPADLSLMLPRSLRQLSYDDVTMRRANGWRSNAAFRQALLFAVGPDSVGTAKQLAVRSPCNGELRHIDVDHGFIRLGFVDLPDNVSRTMILPSCAAIEPLVARWKAALQHLPVTSGEILGDFVERAYYPDVTTLDNVSQGCIAKLEDLFFESLLVHPGELGWRGDGMLIESQYASGSLGSSATEWLDFSHMSEYFDAEIGMYVVPPIPFDPQRFGADRHVNGVFYDFLPFGPRFRGLKERLSGSKARSSSSGDKAAASRDNRKRAVRR